MSPCSSVARWQFIHGFIDGRTARRAAQLATRRQTRLILVDLAGTGPPTGRMWGRPCYRTCTTVLLYIGRWQRASQRRDSARNEVMSQYLRSSASDRTSCAAAHSGTRRSAACASVAKHLSKFSLFIIRWKIGRTDISRETCTPKLFFVPFIRVDVYSQKYRLLSAIVDP